MWIVKYRAASQVSKVNDSLAGTFLYYADPIKALDAGFFVEKLVSFQEHYDHRVDFLGQPFRAATEQEVIQFRHR